MCNAARNPKSPHRSTARKRFRANPIKKGQKQPGPKDILNIHQNTHESRIAPQIRSTTIPHILSSASQNYPPPSSQYPTNLYPPMHHFPPDQNQFPSNPYPQTQYHQNHYPQNHYQPSPYLPNHNNPFPQSQFPLLNHPAQSPYAVNNSYNTNDTARPSTSTVPPPKLPQSSKPPSPQSNPISTPTPASLSLKLEYSSDNSLSGQDSS